MTCETVCVELGARGYEIRVGSGLVRQLGKEIAPLLARPRVAAIVDENAATHHLPALKEGLAAAGIDWSIHSVPSGEAAKSWRQLELTVEWLLEQQIERRDTVLAFGGGVVGDLTGFAAAILRRGVNCVQVPTTLLAQVDSAIGGKTGINSRSGKNLIGAFHQPLLVLCDIDLLATLPHRDFRAGCGEVAKYGLIRDSEFFRWLESTADGLRPDRPDAVRQAVRRSCEIKAEFVAADQYEHGARGLLNLGHTFGHALEAACGYSDRLLHGEAVAIGCCLAFDLSRLLGHCRAEDTARVESYFKKLGMKTRIAELDGGMDSDEALLRIMKQDKKVIGGRRRFVLARAVGDAFMSDKVEVGAVKEVLANSRRTR